MKKILMACAISVLGFSSVSANTHTVGLSLAAVSAILDKECQGGIAKKVVDLNTKKITIGITCPGDSEGAVQPTTPIISSTVNVSITKPTVNMGVPVSTLPITEDIEDMK